MFKLNKDIEIGNGKLLLLAGPCVAESREICLKTAAFLKDVCKKLDINYVFKASFDKANRSSANTFRGKGLDYGLNILKEVKSTLELPIVTDVHESSQIQQISKVADIIQIPAFLCRQTDLLLAAGKSEKVINIKKGQFMAPEDMKGAIEKIYSTKNNKVMLTERGTTFGYHNLVVDMRSFPTMKSFNVPVVFDATHSVQLPGGLGNSSGGQREFVETLTLAATAVGIDALFMEVHPDPENALSDGPNSLNFQMAEALLQKVRNLYEYQRKNFKN
ncbi:MAG: 3-deoxy-8-phosphooctulonate synthase [bacterium]|nr:3-deoxy-8-phosphooctulonate synthase [bacterium]